MTTGSLVARCLSAAVGCAALACPRDARAEGPPHSPDGPSVETSVQIAQSLFDDARALLESGRYAEACPKFAESQRVDPGGGTLLNLALCHELEGRTATAWLEFREALAQAIRDQRDDRVALARSHIDGLLPKLAKVTVHVPDDLSARNPEVCLDRAALPRSAWGIPIPVDPGEHEISVVVSGARWETSVVAREPGAVYDVKIAAPSAPPSDGAGKPGERRRGAAFWVVLSGAAVFFVASGITGILALDADAYVRENCSSARDFCRVGDAGESASRARALAWTSTVTLGAGVAAVAVAFLLPREARPRSGQAGPVGLTVMADGTTVFGALRFSGL